MTTSTLITFISSLHIVTNIAIIALTTFVLGLDAANGLMWTFQYSFLVSVP